MSQGTCPMGGLWHVCTENTPTFFGCCISDPCNVNGCPSGDLLPAGMGTGAGPDKTSNDSSFWPNVHCAAGKWWTCADQSPSFQGCCESNPCGGDDSGCPSDQLFAAAFSTIPLLSESTTVGSTDSSACIAATMAKVISENSIVDSQLASASVLRAISASPTVISSTVEARVSKAISASPTALSSADAATVSKAVSALPTTLSSRVVATVSQATLTRTTAESTAPSTAKSTTAVSSSSPGALSTFVTSPSTSADTSPSITSFKVSSFYSKSSSASPTATSPPILITSASAPSQIPAIVGGIAGGIVLLIVLRILYCLYRRRRPSKRTLATTTSITSSREATEASAFLPNFMNTQFNSYGASYPGQPIYGISRTDTRSRIPTTPDSIGSPYSPYSPYTPYSPSHSAPATPTRFPNHTHPIHELEGNSPPPRCFTTPERTFQGLGIQELESPSAPQRKDSGVERLGRQATTSRNGGLGRDVMAGLGRRESYTSWQTYSP